VCSVPGHYSEFCPGYPRQFLRSRHPGRRSGVQSAQDKASLQWLNLILAWITRLKRVMTGGGKSTRSETGRLIRPPHHRHPGRRSGVQSAQDKASLQRLNLILAWITRLKRVMTGGGKSTRSETGRLMRGSQHPVRNRPTYPATPPSSFLSRIKSGMTNRKSRNNKKWRY
jgi:hypothetical protein